MYSEDFKHHLTKNLIPFWNSLEDTDHGGFYGTVDKNLNINKYSPKGVILNNRILWFYSNAYRLLKDPILLEKAEHAFHFLYETSFGHDIETAWLMDRTCEIISDKSYQQMLTQITDTLTTAVYNSAYDFENHGLFNKKENNTTDQQKNGG